MWYHASFFFDYIGWLNKINSTLQDIDQGNYSILRSHVLRILNQDDKRKLLLKFGGFIPDEFISKIDSLQDSPYKNSIIGRCLFITIFEFYSPIGNHLGYEWRIIVNYLRFLGWREEDIQELIHGLPFGNLLNKVVIPYKTPNDSDPYWYWIRPDYSFNQGGWLPNEKIEYFLDMLSQIQAQTVASEFFRSLNLPEKDIKSIEKSYKKGLMNLIQILRTGLIDRVGIYSAIYHEWDEE